MPTVHLKMPSNDTTLFCERTREQNAFKHDHETVALMTKCL